MIDYETQARLNQLQEQFNLVKDWIAYLDKNHQLIDLIPKIYWDLEKCKADIRNLQYQVNSLATANMTLKQSNDNLNQKCADLQAEIINLKSSVKPPSNKVNNLISDWGDSSKSVPPRQLATAYDLSKKRLSTTTTPAATKLVTNAQPRTITVSAVTQKRLQQVMQDYNALPNTSGAATRMKRNEFLKKYQIVVLKCENYIERIHDPKIFPKFVPLSDSTDGECWAIPLNNTVYAVMPNYYHIYDSSCHDTAGLGLLFDSNYVVNNSYKNIRLQEMAIMMNTGSDWQLKNKGRLSLS